MDGRQASVLLALAIVLSVLLFAVYNPDFMPAIASDAGSLASQVRRFGAWAPVVIVALQAAQVLLAPIPGQALGIASGYLFGTFGGAFYSLIGTAIGSLLAFNLARLFGRPLVERLVPADILARLDLGARRQGLFFFVLVFLLPFLPDDLACFAGGVTSIPIPALLAASVVGRAPGILVASWLGAKAVSLNIWQWAVLLLGSAILAASFLAYGEHLQVWLLERAAGRPTE